MSSNRKFKGYLVKNYQFVNRFKGYVFLFKID